MFTTELKFGIIQVPCMEPLLSNSTLKITCFDRSSIWCVWPI